MIGKKWGGLIFDSVDQIVHSVVELYKNQELWNSCQKNGADLMNELFNKNKNSQQLMVRINSLLTNALNDRKLNYTGEMIQ